MPKIAVLILVLNIFVQNAFAQDYTRWGLPEDAKMRLGKGGIRGNITYFLDGKYLAVSCSNGIWIYDAHTDKPLQFLTELRTTTRHEEGVDGIAFSPDGSLFASGSYDHTIRLCDIKTGTELRTMGGHVSGVISVAFSPDGVLLASCSKDLTARLWSVQTGELLWTFLGHTRKIKYVTFSLDGKPLASGSSDGTVLLWDVGK